MLLNMLALTSSIFIFSTLFTNVYSIGEGGIDVNTFAGLINGIGYLLKNDIEPVDVPSKVLMGKWYQMYKSALSFDGQKTQSYCALAYFKQNSIMGADGFSIEEGFRTGTKNGHLDTYKRDLNKVGLGKYWMYTEEYFYPKQFHIMKVGPTYNNETKEGNIQYIVVSDANRMGLLVYAREPIAFYQHYNKEVTEFLEKAGFGGKVFWNAPKPIYQGQDCEYPSEKEVFARRVMKNMENAQRAKENEKNGIKNDPNNVEAESPFAALLQNPQLALQKLVQRN
uniref:Lipocalin/cytosolic fatty-acid binding domain-containing protein n=1 Tax=Rhabditophanes sp. KR3021 TaxID=114890 RepID=A0AC35U5N8_9BILA